MTHRLIVNVHVHAYCVSAFEHFFSWECKRKFILKLRMQRRNFHFEYNSISFDPLKLIFVSQDPLFLYFLLRLLAPRKRNGLISYKKIIEPNHHTINQKFFRSQHFSISCICILKNHSLSR